MRWRFAVGRGLTILLLPAALLLGGCSPVWQGYADTVRAAWGGAPPLVLTRAQIDAIPYAQIKLRTEGGEATLVLFRQQGALEYWESGTRQVVMLRHGLVVRTVGFSENLGGMDEGERSPFALGLQNLPDGYQSERRIDLPADYRMGVPVRSRFERKGMETLDILGTPHRLLRVDEHLSAPLAGIEATNRYWVDPQDGFVMQSAQQVTPTVSMLITQLKPNPARGGRP